MLNQHDSMHGLFFIRATVFAAVVLGIVASLTGARAGEDKNGLRIAVVNPGKLVSEYKFAKASTETLEKLGGETQVALDAWGKYPLLTVADQDALVKLLQKEKPGVELSKAEKDDIQRLITKHENLLKEYNDLLVKPNGQNTAQDIARLDAFKKLQTDTVNRISAKKADATTEIGKKQDEFNVKI